MSYRQQDPRGQHNYNNYNNYNNNNYNNYNNSSGNQSGYRGEYPDGGYPQRQYSNPRNPRMLETNDGYRPSNRNPYPPNSNIIGSPPRGQTADDDDDNVSVVSSVYSQPSVMGGPQRNYQEQPLETTEPRRYQEQYLETIEPLRFQEQPLETTESRSYQEQYSETTEPRRYQEQYLETTEPRRYQEQYFNEYDHPPSPLAASTNTHNSSTGLTAGSQQDQNQYEKAYNMDNMDHYDPSQTKQTLDVYNDFNNNNYRSDDEDGSRYNTLTGDGYDANPYAMNTDYNKDFSGNGKGAENRLSVPGGDHYVVTSEKKRRCAICSRKTCVITTFVILVLLAAGMYFVWPRIPEARFLSSSAIGNAEITTTPAAVKMQMDLEFELDNRENWLPYKFKSLDIDVFSGDDAQRPIAKGNKDGFSIPGRAKSTVTIPISIDYSGSAPNDQILQSFIGACTQSENGVKTTLNLIVNMKMLILGLDWVKKPIITLPLINFQCPFNIPSPNAPAPAPPAEQPPAPQPPADTPPADTPPAGGAPTTAPPAGGAGGGGAPATAPPAGGGGAPATAPPAGGGAPAPPAGGAPAKGAPTGGAPDGAPADPATAPPADTPPAGGGGGAPADGTDGAPPTDGAPAA